MSNFNTKKVRQSTLVRRAINKVSEGMTLTNILRFVTPKILDPESKDFVVSDKAKFAYTQRPVAVLVAQLDPKTGKPFKDFDVSLFDIKYMLISELNDNFVTEADGDYAEEFYSVFLASSAKKVLGQDEDRWHAAIRWVTEKMQDAGDFPFIVGARKSRITFARKELMSYKIFRDFVEGTKKKDKITGKVTDNGANRLEHLIQLLNAHGIALKGGIPRDMLQVIESDASDGHVFMLRPEVAELWGITEEGLYQHRSVEPYTKGTILVSGALKGSYINMASIKVKSELPEILRGQDVVIIQSSGARPFDEMRMGHQDFYCMESYGQFPRLIRDNLRTQIGGKDLIERSMPAEVSALVSLGLPYDYIQKPAAFMDSLLLQARPKVAHMFLLAMVSKEYLRDDIEEGWYIPTSLGRSDYSNLIDRSPRMAIGGAFQEVEWVMEQNANGEWVEKYSPIPDVLLLVVDGEPGKYKTARSKLNAQIIADTGADVDGDRMAISTREGAKWRREAGLAIKTNLPTIKAKDNYPGVDWTEEGRIKMSYKSNPRVAAVGQGDVPTQNARSLYLAGEMSVNTWDRMAWAGANKVQEGVSAPKYFFKSNVAWPIQPNKLAERAKDLGVGLGYLREGKLWEPARKYIEQRLGEIFPETPKAVTVGAPGEAWKGGYTFFLDQLAIHDSELGDVWITHVRRTFAQAMKRQGIKSITDKSQPEHKLVAKYIARFIKDHADKPHIWTWLLKPQYLGLEPDEKNKVLRKLGMPFSAKVLAENADKDPEATIE